LTEAIENLKARNPQAIGIDLYRDLPVEPGHQALVEAYKSTPNLIGIEKVVGSRVAPPPVLERLGQVGFADVVLDADGKIRRGLMSVELDGQLHLSFAVKLALIYLESVGITPEPLEENRLRLGQVTFTPFNENDGGYVRASAGGYQILLNFRGPLENFHTISLTDVLANRIPAELLDDSSNGASPNPVVAIGGIAESLNDLFQTPYSSSLFRSPRRMAGVIVHANITSQLLSAALEGRPPIRVWSTPQEWLWILAWAVIGAVLSWRLKFPSRIAIGIVLTSLGLSAGTYLAFLQGWWLPLVPSILGLVGAAIALPIMTNKQLERLQLRRTLELLRQNCATAPVAGQIAIEYLKKSENQNNQALIERWLAED
jgi:CHASE2 domain-containing sensor protein